jgi:hypothetical protein
MGDQNTVLPQAGVVKIPKNYPKEPQSEKVALLFTENRKDLYSKFSPFGHDKGNIFGSSQPYMWNPPGRKDSPLAVFKGIPTGLDLTDTARLAKYIASGRGLIFLGKQFLLQAFQPFNETKLYNPAEVLISSSRGVLPRPTRHIDLGNGILGALLSVIGFNSGRGRNPPSGTAGAANPEVLSRFNKDQGAGLIRGVTATSGYYQIKSKWESQSGPQKQGFLKAVGNYFKSQLSELGQGLLPQRQPVSIFYKADEATIVSMIENFGVRLNYDIIDDPTYFILKKYNIRNWALITSNEAENILFIRTPTDTYLKSVKPFPQEPPKSKLEELHGKVYQNKAKEIKSELKYNDQSSDAVKIQQENLQKIIDDLELAGYDMVLSTNQKSLSNPKDTVIGYDKIYQVSKDGGMVSKYYDQHLVGRGRTLDSGKSIVSSRKFSSKNRSDGLNRISLFYGGKEMKNMVDYSRIKDDLGKDFSGWNTYEPYKDDLIAFFFYDVVNDTYIPFRATIKGLNESNSAEWDSLAFIGRADRIYSYNGFSRTLSFNFSVVIQSIKELFPSWKKINYIASSVKPSKYNSAYHTRQPVLYNRFIIPPMFMLTIGDLYKFQPIIITAVNVIIPDTATWETTSEQEKFEWSYLNNVIFWPNSKGKVAQMPMEADINITCNILEKELAKVGGGHYGHSPVETVLGDQPKSSQASGDVSKPVDAEVTTTKPTRPLVNAGVPYLPLQEEFSQNLRL